ncbi:TPA: lysozyme inhibitor LprI family protein [Vibrio cholerae]
MKKTLGILILTLLSVPAYSAIRNSEIRDLEKEIIKKEWPECLTPNNYYDQVYCASKVYGVVDDVLNDQYKNTVKLLSKEQSKSLKTVQIKWIRNRDDKCAKIIDGSVVLDLSCSTKLTVESIYYLKQIERNPNDFKLLLNEYERGE